MSYSFDDLKILEDDTTDDPNSFTPKMSLPGDIYGKNYRKRLRHTFPEGEGWRNKVEVEKQEVPRWKQYLFKHYIVKPFERQKNSGE